MQWHTTPPPLPVSFFLSARCTAFFQPSPIFLILRPIKALLAYITPLPAPLSLPHSRSFIHTLTLGLSSVHIPAHSHTLAQTTALFFPVAQEVVISLWAPFTLTVPNERFPNLPLPVTLPSPFSAFSITILSDSFIYSLSSFIPLPIILAGLPFNDSLPCQTHTSSCSLFHQCCHFCQPISPSSVLLPPLSFLIASRHH